MPSASFNPFEDNDGHDATMRSTNNNNNTISESSIWAARHVEWPLPSSLSVSQYNKLQKASLQLAQQLGLNLNNSTVAVAANSTAATASTTNADAISTDGTPYYSGISGFMSRVLNTNTGNNSSNANSNSNNNINISANDDGQRPLSSPRSVAAANGWIVASLECTPALRLVSRWNVRRGSVADHWTVLPPPVNYSSNNTNNNNSVSTAIKHVLVDPTASHMVFSANNGELYYLHSSSAANSTINNNNNNNSVGKDTKTALPAVKKLAGFGPNADGSTLTNITGVTAAMDVSKPQTGITPGSYVTCIAWDTERGTEGTSKRVLLGTNIGELYEYTFISPTCDIPEEKAAAAMPVLLHKLSNDPVTGIYMECLRTTGWLVLVATAGRNNPTRLYTFSSIHDSSLRNVLADEQHASLVELPGSIESADLRVCQDHLALLTETGLFYGTIDRSFKSAMMGGTSILVDTGILPYTQSSSITGGHKSKSGGGGGNSGNFLIVPPASLAVTPHHWITLNELNQVQFTNRIAQKVIQSETLDASDDMQVGSLLMDVRRPDQVWFRKGRSLIHISSSQEDRDVWKYTLQKCLRPRTSTRSTSSSNNKSTSLALFDRFGIVELTEEEKAQEAMFEHAKSLCTNAAQKAVVTAVRAEYHLAQGRAELAAKYLAQCPSTLKPFADTSVRLALPKLISDDNSNSGTDIINTEQTDKAGSSLKSSNLATITYLQDKMRLGKELNDDKMTSTMIGAWLTELYLHERGERSTIKSKEPLSKEAENAHKTMLAQFLNSHVNNMDATTIMKILMSHDIGASECANYAAKSGDIATAVNSALCVGAKSMSGANVALQILDDAPFELAETLYYKNAPILLARAPAMACESFLMRYHDGLSPLRLLPCIMNYERLRAAYSNKRSSGDKSAENKIDVSVDGPKSNNDGFELRLDTDVTNAASFVDDSSVSAKYLEGVVKLGCKNSAVYSYLISLYTKMEDEEPLLKFLTWQLPMNGTSEQTMSPSRRFANKSYMGEASDPNTSLDMPFALRTVLATGRHYRSAIKLYMGFGMRQQAVELALKVDPSLARELAQDSVELDERKQLWLMIAKNAAADSSSRGGKDVVSRVVSVLKDCGPDVLSIEDVLPFLPDFAQIDQIKDEICEALTSYSSKIEQFLNEMSECDKACYDLREEINHLRNYRMRLKTTSKCALTGKLIMNAGEPFYVFPSGFVFLSSALKATVLPHLNEKQTGRLKEIEQQLKQAKDHDRPQLQNELDGLIAAECPLTGTMIVDDIDKDFMNSDEVYERTDLFKSDIERVEV